jgi:glucose/arabinose dehydrogenase/N-acetylneuraminic acid mutarotase
MHLIPDTARCTVESLEGRTLLAVTLPDGFEQTQWTRGFNTPTAQEFAPDGRLFVTEKAGAVRVVSANGELLDKPFVKVDADTYIDRGLVSLAFDPDFENNGFVYLYYTFKKGENDSWNRLSRFKADKDNPNVAAKGSERVLLESRMDSALHTGGMMHFGTDGMLYLGIGDSGSGGRAQRLNDIRGKILRLNVANFPNSIIPQDNPFVGEANVREEIWALGFRNPFSGGIDPVTGKVFVNDVGHESFEEVNHVQAGRNYGWPLAEGLSNNDGFVNPIYNYPKNNVGAAVTGGVFYRGSAMPAGYNGTYLFADFLRGWIKRLDPDDANRVVDFATSAEGPLDLDVGPDGSIYYLSAFGRGFDGENRPVYRISWVGGDNRQPQAVATASVTNGGLPLKVKFTGDQSSDPDGDGLTYSWDFDDGSAPVNDANPTHTFTRKGRYKVRLTVHDGKGGTDRSETISILAGYLAPKAKIRLPLTSPKYVAGDKIAFAGTGKDAEDGKLKKNRFEWSVVFVHADHTHEFKPSIPGVLEGKFRTATRGETAPDQGYLITLTVRDRHGLTGTDSVLIRPRKVDVTVRTNLKNLKFAVDGHEFTGSTTFVGVAGLERELSAPKTQTVNGQQYTFAGWSDDGNRNHVARTPKKDVVYVARYVKAPTPGPGPEPDPGGEPGENGLAGAYFNAPDFSGAPVERVDETIEFDWAGGAPIDGVGKDAFSVRWFGQVEAKFSEEYTFIVTSDDGARLTVNGKVLIDALDETGLVQRKGTIKLKAGERYDIELEYVEGTGNAVAWLEWKSERTPRQVVPRKRLFAGDAEGERSKGLRLLAASKTAPEAPSKLVAEARSSRKIRLAWRDNSRDETAFRLYRKGPGESSYKLLAKLPKNSRKYVDMTGEENTKYTFRVRAANKAGGSAYSNKATATTFKRPDPGPDPGGKLNLVWQNAASAPVGRHEAVGTVANGKLYVFGGFTENLRHRNDVWSYDPGSDEWKRLADVPQPLSHGSAVVDGDKIYVAGMFQGPDHHADGTTDIWVYDIGENEWSKGVSLPKPRGAAVIVKEGRSIHFFGGLVPGRGSNGTEHWVLNLDGGTSWTTAAPMPNPKDHLSAVELGGKIYAIGGEHLGNDITNNQSDVHVYDPKTDKWKQLASLPVPWSHHTSSTVVVGGRILVLAGETNGRVHLKRVMQYDPATDRWTELNGLPSTRKSPVAGVIGDRIIVHGGEGRGPEATTWVARIAYEADAASAERARRAEPKKV